MDLVISAAEATLIFKDGLQEDFSKRQELWGDALRRMGRALNEHSVTSEKVKPFSILASLSVILHSFHVSQLKNSFSSFLFKMYGRVSADETMLNHIKINELSVYHVAQSFNEISMLFFK